MAIDFQKWGVFGAVAGVGFPYVLKAINIIPGISVQSTIGANIPVQDINTGAAQYLINTLGFGSIGIPEVLMSAAGGALFFILGAWIVDLVGAMKGSDVARVSKVALIAGLATGIILSQVLALPSLVEFVIAVIGSFVTGYILVTVLKSIKMQRLIP